MRQVLRHLVMTAGALWSLDVLAQIPPADWIATGGAADDGLGSATAGGGDANGDGFADLAVVEQNSSADGLGRVLVYFGSAQGLSAAASVTVAYGYNFGKSVAWAGDVNGDGFDDLLVGSSTWELPAPDDCFGITGPRGHAELFLGPSFSAPPVWRYLGQRCNARLGNSVAGAGDVNNDGYADVVVGSQWDGPSQDGRAYVFYGGPGGLPANPSVILDGPSSSYPSAGAFGLSVSGAGDVNADGFDDVIVGDPHFDDGSYPDSTLGFVGAAYVYLGSSLGLNATPHWTVHGTGTNYTLAARVASAGDVDGDGYDDVVVNARGAINIYRGGLAGPSTSPAWTFALPSYGSAAGGGDLDGDGFGDVIVMDGLASGSPDAPIPEVRIYQGSPTGPMAAPSWRASDSSPYVGFGGWFGAAGDVNGDGFSDWSISSPDWDLGGSIDDDRGRVYTYHGREGLALLDANCETPDSCSGTYHAGDGRSFASGDALLGPHVRRSAVAADGVTTLFVRVPASEEVSFRLERLDGSEAPVSYGHLDTLTSNAPPHASWTASTPQSTSQGWFAFVRFVAPEDLPEPTADPKKGVDVVIHARTASGGTEWYKKLTILPPPLVLVHGVWSDGEAWKGLDGFLTSRGFRICGACRVDYGSLDNAAAADPIGAGPENAVGQRAVAAGIAHALKEDRGNGIAVAQVDVIAHSLGGLITKGLPFYARVPWIDPRNFDAGDVHKLITVGTPHNGSPFARWVVKNRCSAVYIGSGSGNAGTLSGLLAGAGRRVGRALFDMQPGSEALRHLGHSGIPGHPVVGYAPGDSCMETTLDQLMSTVESDVATVDGLLGATHDTIVPTSSQTGNWSLVPDSISDVVHAKTVPCTRWPTIDSETSSLQVWQTVQSLLTRPRSTDFEPFGEPPPFPAEFAPPRFTDAACPPLARAPLAPSSATATLSAPSAMSPGQSAPVTLTVTGGNPVDGAIFWFPDHFESVEGTAPLTTTVTVPMDDLGVIDVYADTYGPGPENYSAATSINVYAGGTPVAIEVFPNPIEFEDLNDTAQLRVEAVYSGGRRYDVTRAYQTSFGTVSGTWNVVVAYDRGRGLIRSTGEGSDAVRVTHAGVSVTVPATVVVTNRAPILEFLADRDVLAGTTIELPIHATDPDGDVLVLAGVALPSWAQVIDDGGGNGTLRLAPGLGDIGGTEFGVSATDDGSPRRGALSSLWVNVVDPASAGSLLGYYASTIADGCLAAPGVGDGAASAGEDVELVMAVLNERLMNFSAVVGTLGAITPGVTVTRAQVVFPDTAGPEVIVGNQPFRFTVGTGVPCGATLDFQLTMSSAQGSWTSSFSIGSGRDVRLASGPLDLPILDESTVTTGLAHTSPGGVSSVEVVVWLDHTYDSDLRLALTSPSGVTVPLSEYNGGSDDDYRGTLFADAAAVSVVDGAAPFAGRYRPQVPLSTLLGSDAQGVWTLSVEDAVGGDTGVLHSWWLHVVSDSPSCAACPVPLPGEPSLLRWTGSATRELQWDAAPSAGWYNVYEGSDDSVSALTGSAADSCLRWSGTTLSTTGASLPDPAVGRWAWYIVRASNAAGEGPEGAGTAGPRMLDSQGPCP